ncbi:MAG: chaperone NapD [Deltaproteobacteria bacterium]|nr:MAG: chaperone NapD [Deltaproteobacteria bacterium]
MVISGVVVVCAPERMVEAESALEGYDWLEVHHRDSAGRMVVTLETADADESSRRLQEIQRLPQILLAELAEYVLEGQPPRATRSSPAK